MNSKWVSFSPHILSKNSTTKTYLTMMILLCPVLASAIVNISIMPLAVVAVCMLTAFITDLVFKLIVDRRFDFTEISSLFIGLVIALCLPTGVGVVVPIISTVFSMLFIRNIAGGIGKNFVSEIAVAVILSYLIFPNIFSSYITEAGTTSSSFLSEVLAGKVSEVNITNLLFGGVAGTIADASIFWLIIAGIGLTLLKVVDARVPITVILSTFVFAILFYDVTTAVNLVLGGSVLIVAFFVATDYAVVPSIKWLKYVYGILIGFLTVILWKYSNAMLAVFYAVIIAGLLGCVMNGIIKASIRRRA